MGFFTKKKEEPKNDGQFAMGLDCPVCKKNSLLAYLVFNYKDNNKDIKMNGLLLHGLNSGICTNCGVIGFGELLFKTNSIDKSTEIFEKLVNNSAKIHLKLQKILESTSEDKRTSELSKAINDAYNQLKTDDPLFFNSVRFDLFFQKSIKHYTENIDKYKM
jgi:hypothetical protein